VWKKNLTSDYGQKIHRSYPQENLPACGQVAATDTPGSTPEGTADLIIFDGVFDR